MARLTRRDLMLKAIIKNRKKNIIEIGKRKYPVTDYLSKKNRLKKWVLGTMMMVLSFSYFFYMERYDDIPFAEAEVSVIVEGFTITFLFMFSVVVGFILISLMFIPKDFQKHIKKELF